MALAHEGHGSDMPATEVDVFIIPVDTTDYAYAIEVAQGLRKDDLRVEIGVRERSISSHLAHIAKRNIAFAAIVGETEVNRVVAAFVADSVATAAGD